MAKIVLGTRPGNFSRAVKFPLLEGGEGEILCEFNFRSRSEYAKWIDAATSDMKIEPDAAGVYPTVAEIIGRTVERQTGMLVDALAGWDLAGPVTPENLREVSDVYPAAAVAIIDTYRNACLEGRVGN